jgi:hypothetical protein
MRQLIAITAGLALTLPGAASAATVSVSVPVSRYEQQRLIFEAAPGESNSVTITRAPGGLQVADAGPPLDAGANCRAVDAHTVVCRDGKASIDLADGDDSVDLSAGPDADVDGGPGADTITGSADADDLSGGDGTDTIDGGPGADTIAGDGSLLFADRLSGGRGEDTLDYDEHSAPVTVTLPASGPATAGAEAEGDVIDGFEDVTSGRRGDDLTGNERANELWAGPGGRLHGLAGNDFLSIADGGYGDGGDGNDSIAAQGARRATIDCGPGRDVVVSPHPTALLRPGCEFWDFYYLGPGSVRVPVVSRVRGGRLSLVVPCPESESLGTAPRGRCTGSVRLDRDAGGRTLARRPVTIATGRSARVVVLLAPRDLARARRPGGLGVRVRYSVRHSDNPRAVNTGGYRTTVRAR